MKKLLFLCLVLNISVSIAQTTYEKGYYIESNGNKTEGFIRIIDFDKINDIEKLDFKKNKNDKNVKIDLASVNELGIGSELKFIKVSLLMDDVNLHKDFKFGKDLDLKKTTVFINVEIEGTASLYSFASSYGIKFFYKLNGKDDEIVQLVYKKYLSEDIMKKNTFFRNQLFNDVKCEDQVFNDFLNLEYDKIQLVKVFKKFNDFKVSNSVMYKNKFEKSFKTHLSGFAGVNLINNPTANSFTYGGEFEFVFPSEKLSFFMKAEYESFTSEAMNVYFTAGGAIRNEDTFKADAKSVDFIIGARYNYKINNSHKVFVSAGLAYNEQSGSITASRKLILSGVDDTVYPLEKYELKTKGFFYFGIGYLFHNRFGIDLNYDTNKAIYKDQNTSFKLSYNNIGVNFRFVFY